jgi:hypothetical protein
VLCRFRGPEILARCEVHGWSAIAPKKPVNELAGPHDRHGSVEWRLGEAIGKCGQGIGSDADHDFECGGAVEAGG